MSRAAPRASISAARSTMCAAASSSSTTLHARGHEIASHAVGHFDGRHWSASDWKREFDSFDQAFSNVAANNGLPADAGFSFPLSEITGFRAPYLATSPGLYATMNAGRFRYHTNGDAEADAWPVKENNLWRFSLANIRITGARRKTLSMDYNFLVAQSMGLDHPRLREQLSPADARHLSGLFQSQLHRQSRADAYRASLHRLSARRLSRSAEVLRARASAACRKCAASATGRWPIFMDKESPQTLAAYQKGDFARAPMPKIEPGIVASEAPVAARHTPQFALRLRTHSVPLPSRAWRACA